MTNRRPAPPGPNLDREQQLLAAGGSCVVGVDEVGRGALAGPVCVGAFAVDQTTGPAPIGLADSKKLRPAQRQALTKPLANWGIGRSLGWAEARVVDQLGIIGALRQAAWMALKSLNRPDCIVLLDGSHNYLTRPQTLDQTAADEVTPFRRVITQVKGDLTCASVAAASVWAKTARDAVMIELAQRYPGYGWDSNMGYGAPAHRQAIDRLGVTPQHRQTWRLSENPGRLAAGTDKQWQARVSSDASIGAVPQEYGR